MEKRQVEFVYYTVELARITFSEDFEPFSKKVSCDDVVL